MKHLVFCGQVRITDIVKIICLYHILNNLCSLPSCCQTNVTAPSLTHTAQKLYKNCTETTEANKVKVILWYDDYNINTTLLCGGPCNVPQYT